jgi:hypothetical protein
MVCSCGIRLRQWTANTFFCPHCREITATNDKGEQKVIRGEQAEKISGAVARKLREMIKEASPSPIQSPPPHPTEEVIVTIPPPPNTRFLEEIEEVKKKAINDTIPCWQCGHPVKNKCGAKCGMCGWIKPCDLP